MSLDQMRTVCHISKKTARLLLQNGYIPYTNTGKKTHTYLIPKYAVINYLTERENTPKNFVLPVGCYAKSKYTQKKAKSAMYSTLEEYPDVLDVYQAAALAGVAIKTISVWARKNYFESFKRNNAYHIPKVSLVEYLLKN
jgi:predicted site-specific integrase-resolvase